MVDLRIVDPAAPRPYGASGSLLGLGGTEATVLRVARALAGELEVVLDQKARANTEEADGITFRPLELAAPVGRVIVVINAWKVALKLRRANPEARIYLWLHVHPGRHNREMGARLKQADVTIICVSESHAATLAAFVPHRPDIGVIYNPISDDLQPDATERSKDQLLFASAPHKGLPQVIEIFQEVRRSIPDLKLALADPGYMRWPMPPLPQGAMVLGALTHEEVIREFRRSFCLFYPQNRFAETFGLVIAEANAVGCAALVHGDIGANREIASSPEQCIDADDIETIVARLLTWRTTYPTISTRPEFRLSAVASRWKQLITVGHDIPSDLTGRRCP